MTLVRFLFCWLALAGLASAQREPKMEAALSSATAVVGEKVFLTLWVENVALAGWPPEPEFEPLVLKRDANRRMIINGRVRTGFRYLVSSFKPGRFTLPAFEIRAANGIIRSEPLMLEVLPISRLAVQGLKLGGDTIPYLSGMFLEKEAPFVGETLAVEAKLYLSQKPPHLLRMDQTGVVQARKNGLAAWRLTSNGEASGYLDHEGHRFAVYTYTSSLNALSEGRKSFGPGEADVILVRRKTVRGGFATERIQQNLQFPSATLKARPLPPNPPEGFAGAVGSFQMTVRPLETEVSFGGSLTIEAEISGEGNIDQFPGPTLQDEAGDWKQFEMVAMPSGNERRSSAGTVKFSQVIRPLARAASLPPYRFVYFDPLLEDFRTLLSPSVPLSIIGEPPKAAVTETSLAFLEPSGRPLKDLSSPEWLRYWHAVPAFLALLLSGIGAQRHLKGRRIAARPRQQFEDELAQVLSHSDDRVEFYLAASRFATEHRGEEECHEIFETRDATCFRPDAPREAASSEEQEKVASLLRKLAPVVIFLLTFISFNSRADALSPDPATAKSEILAEMQQQASPEHFYNLAICEIELKNLGEAALWAYRFQLHEGEADELLKLLPGARAKAKKGTEWLSALPKDFYLQAIFAAGWTLLLLLLVIRYLTGNARKPSIITLSIILAVCAIVGGLGYSLYPEGVSFEPLDELAVVTDTTALQRQPFDGSEQVLGDAEGSLCRIDSTSGGWSHLTLPNGRSGWVRSPKVKAISE